MDNATLEEESSEKRLMAVTGSTLKSLLLLATRTYWDMSPFASE